MSEKEKLKNFAIIFLFVMTIVFTIQTFTTSLEIKDLQAQTKELEKGQGQIANNQVMNRNVITDMISNITDKCVTKS